MVKEVINNDTTEVDNAEAAILDIYATWCGPCKIIAPLIEELSEEFDGRVEFFKADSEENPKVAKRFKVMSIPNVVLLKKGELISRQIGVKTREEFKSWIEENI